MSWDEPHVCFGGLLALGKFKHNSTIILFGKINISVARRVCDEREAATEATAMERPMTRAVATKGTTTEEEHNI